MKTGLPCSQDREPCPNSETCCGVVCIPALRTCKLVCEKDEDCNDSRNETCVDGFCDCLSGHSCANRFIEEESGKNKSCAVDSDCSRSNVQCRNQTCPGHGVIPTTKIKPEVLPLNPALLAIVTIISVLMFSCLFCCCLSRMKSERKSMKSREAKGKLRSLGIEPSRAVNKNSCPPLKGKSQGTSSEDKSLSGNPKNQTVSGERDEDLLISVVIETNGLPPICEEDEEEEKEFEEGKD